MMRIGRRLVPDDFVEAARIIGMPIAGFLPVDGRSGLRPVRARGLRKADTGTERLSLTNCRSVAAHKRRTTTGYGVRAVIVTRPRSAVTFPITAWPGFPFIGVRPTRVPGLSPAPHSPESTVSPWASTAEPNGAA